MGELRVAIVDDVSLYTRRLMDGFRELGTESVLYAPVSLPPSKSRRIMENLGRDGVKVWTPNLLPLQIVSRALKDKPGIVHIQFEFYGIHSYGPLYASMGIPVLLLMLRFLRMKTVVTLHSVLPRGRQLRLIRDTSPSSKRIPTPLLKTFLFLAYMIIASIANAVVVHAEIFKRRLVEQYRVRPSKVHVIPHGVEAMDESGTRDTKKPGSGPSLILYFGVISPRKGLETLLTAFGMLQERTAHCELWLGGSSPPYYRGYETKLKDLATELGLAPRVRFLGTVDNAYAHQLFSQAKFIVLPYAYDVSASGALSWALSHGLPVIASETEYFKEEMSHTRFGLLVPPGNPKILAEAMETVLTQEDLRESLSENARKMALSRSWRSVAGMTLGSYRNMEIGKSAHERKAL